MRPAAVLERRRAERAGLLASARAFVARLPDALGLRAVAVFGSVARGDFNVWSDVDVLIVAEGLPDDYWSRLAALGDVPSGIEPVVWTSSEWSRQRARGNPIALEAERHGVWLVGSPEQLAV